MQQSELMTGSMRKITSQLAVLKIVAATKSSLALLCGALQGLQMQVLPSKLILKSAKMKRETFRLRTASISISVDLLVAPLSETNSR